MMFEMYQPRIITFQKQVTTADWRIKVYSITNKAAFTASTILEQAVEKLPEWLPAKESGKLPVYNIAFLIVHEAREGVWILVNWWTGGEMIETVVYFARHNAPDAIKPTPHKNPLICVWELEVFAHERQAWITHVLLQANAPDFNNYLSDTLK